MSSATVAGSCSERMDVVILFDVSTSFPVVQLNFVKIALVNIVDNLQDIGSNKIRIGVLSFDAQANILLPLEQGISEAVVMAAIESQEDPTEVGSALSLGLMAAIQQFEDATPRPGVPKRLVVVTDGVYSSSSDLSDSLDVLQTKAIYTTLIGVGVQSTDPDSLGQVITDPNLLSGLLSEVASEKESIVLYQDAAQFMDDENTPVLDAICPDEDDVTCDNELEMVTLRNIGNLDILVSALNFRDEMRNRFPNLNDQLEIDVSEFTELPDAIDIARIHFNQADIVDELGDIDISAFEIQDPPPHVTRMILIISDFPYEDTESAIRAASLAAREVGIIVAVINVAAPAPDPAPSPWLDIVSSIDYLFEVDPAYSWFIQKGLCFADCPSGSEINAEGKCIPCAQGTYRNKDLDYQCQACPNPRTTPDIGAEDIDDCTICPAGMEVSDETCAACQDGFIQPTPSDGPCQECTDPALPFSTKDKTQCRSDCPDGQFWSQSSASCLPCPAGTYKKPGEEEECFECPGQEQGGTTSINGTNNCLIAGIFRFSEGAYTGEEGNPVQMTVIFEPTLSEQAIGDIIANNPGVFEGVTVGFATTGGTATVGVDYELPTEKHCVFPLNVYEKSVNISLLSDNIADPDETIDIALVTPGVPIGTSCPDTPCIVNGMGIGEPSTTTVVITEKIPTVVPTVKFGQSNYSVLENAGNLIVEVLVEYQVPNSVEIGNELPFAPFSIIVMAIDGTALNGVHYLFETQELTIDGLLTDFTTEITDGESSDSKTVTLIILVVVQITDNTVLNGDRQFMLNMSVPGVPTAGQTPSEVAVIGDSAVAMVTIMDNENDEAEMEFKFSTSSVKVSSDATQATVEVILATTIPAGVSPNVGEVSVTITTMDGTALANVHYIPKTETFMFNPQSGELRVQFTVQLLGNDGEEDIYFYVTMSSSSPGTVIGLPKTVTFVIAAAESGGGDDCEPCVDLVIAVDLSRNSAGSECGCVKTFLASLVDRLTISKTCTRTGIIKFAKSSLCVIDLKYGYSDRRVGYQIGKHMKRVSSSSNTDACSALNAMYRMFGKGRRSSVPLKGLLLMDQKSDNTALAVEKANLLKSKGVDLTVIGTDATEVAELGNVGFIINDYCNMTSIDDVINSFC